METKCYLWIHAPSKTKYLFVQTGKDRVQIAIDDCDWAELKIDGVPELKSPDEMTGLKKKYYERKFTTE